MLQELQAQRALSDVLPWSLSSGSERRWLRSLALRAAPMEAESDPRFALEEETSGRSSSGSGLLGVAAAAHDDEGDSDDGDTELNRQPSQLSRLEDEIERLHAQKDSLAEQIEAILEIKAGQEDLGTPEPDLRHEGKRAGTDPLLLYVPTQRLSRICARPCRCRF